MMSPLVDAAGDPPADTGTVNVKKFVLDWSGILAIVAGAVAWTTTASGVDANSREIERLRIANDARAVYDVKQASEMATKSDVQRLSDQIQALSVEFRARAAR